MRGALGRHRPTSEEGAVEAVEDSPGGRAHRRLSRRFGRPCRRLRFTRSTSPARHGERRGLSERAQSHSPRPVERLGARNRTGRADVPRWPQGGDNGGQMGRRCWLELLVWTASTWTLPMGRLRRGQELHTQVPHLPRRRPHGAERRGLRHRCREVTLERRVRPNKRIKLARQSVEARLSRGARSLSAVRWAHCCRRGIVADA